MKALCGSIVFQLTLMAPNGAPSGDLAPWRIRLSSAFQSITWNSASMPTSAHCCWIASFMISGYIWPDPEVEMAILVLSFLAGP